MTTSEVVRFSGVKLTTSPCTFQDLYTIEYHEGRTVLGEDLWDQMKSAVADYSSKPNWSAGTFNQGDVVLYKGTYYEAQQTTDSQPPKSPDWEEAPKFTGECAATFDKIFCEFWAPYMAKRILSIRMPYIRTQVDGLGVLEYNGGSYETSKDVDYSALKSGISRDAAMALGNLKHYLKKQEQKENTCLSNYLEYQNENCNERRKRKRTEQTGIYRFG